MNINYYIDKNNRSYEKEKIIYCYIRSLHGFQGKTIKINTSQRIEPKHWDVAKQQSKRGYNLAPELNDFLAKFKEKIKIKVMEILASEKEFTFEEVKSILTEKNQKKSNDVFTNFDLYLKAKSNIYSQGTKTKYKTFKKHLSEFEKYENYKITFESLNLDFYDRFTNYALNKLSLNNNTIKKLFDLLKAFINWCVEREITNINHTSKFKIKEYDNDIITLTETELKLIENVVLKSEALIRTKDIFLLSVYTGQRYSDISKMLLSDINKKEKLWNLRTTKTKDIIKIPLSKEALNIISKYENEPKFITFISNQKYNNHLKELCKKAGIDDEVTLTRYSGAKRTDLTKPKYELITSHTARRTFVTLSLIRGMQPHIIMKITGHKDFKTLDKYVRIDNEATKTAFEEIWNKASNMKLVSGE